MPGKQRASVRYYQPNTKSMDEIITPEAVETPVEVPVEEAVAETVDTPVAE